MSTLGRDKAVPSHRPPAPGPRTMTRTPWPFFKVSVTVQVAEGCRATQGPRNSQVKEASGPRYLEDPGGGGGDSMRRGNGKDFRGDSWGPSWGWNLGLQWPHRAAAWMPHAGHRGHGFPRRTFIPARPARLVWTPPHISFNVPSSITST